MVEEPVEEGGDGGGVAEELAPVLDRTIRGEQRGGAFVAAHDDLEEILGRGLRQALRMPRSSMMRSGTVVTWREVVLAGAGELGVGELLEEDVGLAVAGRGGPAG